MKPLKIHDVVLTKHGQLGVVSDAFYVAESDVYAIELSEEKVDYKGNWRQLMIPLNRKDIRKVGEL